MQTGNKDDIEKPDMFSLEVGKKLREHRMAVDPEIWESLEGKLSSRSKRFPAYWGWSAAGVAVLLLGLLFFLNPSANKTDIEMTQAIPENREKAQLQADIHADEPYTPQKEATSTPQLFAHKTSPQKREMKGTGTVGSHKDSSNMGKAADAEQLLQTSTPEDIATPAVEMEPDELNAKTESAITEMDEDPAALLSADDNSTPPVQTQDKQQHAFLLAMGSGNGLPDITFGEYGGSESYYYDNPVPGGGFSSDAEPGSGEAYNLFTPGDYTEIVHHLPVTISLTADFPVGKNVSLETGLSYTYLFSSFKRNDQLVYRGTLQQHYVGIPVNLRYQIWQNDSWNLYLLGGATVEKGIRSIYKQEIEQQGDVVHHTHVYNRIAGLQFSAQGGAGFSYRLQNNLHLFGEPRLLYYFRNNQPMSARTENPLIFGLNVGVRMQFK